jgi:hypothetical protein
MPGIPEALAAVPYELPAGSNINPLLGQNSIQESYVTQAAATVVGTSIALDAAGDEFVGGTVFDGSGNAVAGFVAKYLPGSTTLDTSFNPGGAVPGIEAFTGGNGLDVRGVATAQGNVYAVGSLAVSATEARSYIIMFDAGANIGASWTLRWDTPAVGPNAFNAITTDAAGNIYVAGVAGNAANFPGGAGTIASFDNPLSQGSIEGWAVYFTDGSPSANKGLAVDAGGTFALTAGSFTDATTGAVNGLDEAWALPLPPASPTFIVDVEGPTDLFGGGATGNVAFTGVALVPGTVGVGYFSGVATDQAGLGNDGIVTVVDTVNTTLIGTPFVVADGTSSFNGIAVGASGNIYVIGTDVNQATGQTNAEVFVLQYNSGSQVFTQIDGAVVGSPTGSGAETGVAIALDANENVYGVGTSTSTDASTDGTVLNGPSDAWFFILSNP